MSGQFFIAMAYYEGETLKQRIERGPMTIAEVGGVASLVDEQPALTPVEDRLDVEPLISSAGGG